MRSSVLVLVIVVVLFHAPTHGDRSLTAALARMQTINGAMMPNIRESLDDCAMRYYKYDQYEPVRKPLVRPRQTARQVPHLAAIGWTGAITKWRCAGTLVWESFILTSARCTVDENNVAPDVARVGDVDLGSEEDNQYVQELKIAEVIRHPEFKDGERDHDIALLRLETNVTLDSTVVPACLWNQDAVHYRAMHVTGWQTTDRSGGLPKLWKVDVRPATGECNGANSSLHFACVEGSEPLTCSSLDGKLLQVDLHHNAKMTPFIVGISSSPNGSCVPNGPASYTKISSYVAWIQKTIESRGESAWGWKFKPAECALRYVHLRQYEPNVVIARTETQETVDPSRATMQILYSEAVVEIRFFSFISVCFGVIIDEQHVLTLAQCTTQYGRRAKAVRSDLLGYTEKPVVDHFNHPGYIEGEHRNNIGILKMRDRFDFRDTLVPYCIGHEAELPLSEVKVAGQGRWDLNFFSEHNKSVNVFQPMMAHLLPRAEILSPGNCSYRDDIKVGLPGGLFEEHLCYGNEQYIVPETCSQDFGRPIGGFVERFDKTFRYAYALTSFGQDCGFGSPAVGVRLAHHAHWIKSIMLPDYRKDSGSVFFINSDLLEGDTCRHVDGAGGTCVDASRCPAIRYGFSVNRQVVFCTGASIVCCPYENIVNETSAAGRELDDCAGMYREERDRTAAMMYSNGPVQDDNPHMVQLGTENSDGQMRWNCRGTIISRTVVVTGCQCLLSQGSKPMAVRLGMSETASSVEVKEVIYHPDYTNTTKQFDVALVRLKSPIDTAASGKFPACLWTNQTHTPFKMIQTVINETVDEYTDVTAKYNSDCAWSAGNAISQSQLCVAMGQENNIVSSGDPLFWSNGGQDNDQRVEYLVGMTSYSAAKDKSIHVHSRMSWFASWIKNII
ncbi:uncharacterized protein LOC126581377 [Anopheles aquasalis]|uniref:uncharacterized protein LOC126581377 n=1 Tax=Anopheles aquasalis TaxID=42839 RepID=UPI00215AA0EC|nr:uncharacterized protein LOC126581377 [Anopheles aquasalis]